MHAKIPMLEQLSIKKCLRRFDNNKKQIRLCYLILLYITRLAEGETAFLFLQVSWGLP